MEFQLDSKHLKGPAGVALAVVLAVAGLAYTHWRRGQLIEQGTAQVQEYLRLELPSRYMRELTKEGREEEVDPQRLDALSQVEVLELSPSWFFRADRDRGVKVKVIARTGDGAQVTGYFRFKRQLGGWKLVREIDRPFLEAFF